MLLYKILCKKACEREKQCEASKNKQSEEHAETDEDNATDAQIDADGRLSFTITVADKFLREKEMFLNSKKLMLMT